MPENEKTTAKQRFEQPYEVSAPVWELEPFAAIVKFDFGLFSEGTRILFPFRAGDVIEECSFGCREYVDKKRWVVRFEKNGFLFQISAPDFFKIFDA